MNKFRFSVGYRKNFRGFASAAFAVAAVTALCAFSASGADTLTAEDRRMFAEGLFSRGLYSRAAVEYEALAKEFPQMEGMDVSLFRWAEALRLSGKPADAGTVLVRLIRSYPNSPYKHRAMFQRAAIAISLDQFETASELADALLSENPDAQVREPALYFKAEALSHLDGKGTAAIPVYELLLKDYPDGEHSGFARLSLGKFLAERNGGGDAARAAGLFRLAAQKPMTPRLGAEALYMLARSEFAAGRFKESSDAYADLEKRYPDDMRTASAALQGAWASYQSGLYADVAAKAAKALVRADSGSRDEWLYLKGDSEFRSANYKESLNTFADLLRSFPNGKFASPARFRTAEACRKTGDNAKASESALAIKAGDPCRRDALWLLGETYGDMKDSARAIQYSNLFVTEFPSDSLAPSALFRLAREHQNAGAWEDAAETYRRISSGYPTSDVAEQACFAAGFCFMKAANPVRAIQEWNGLASKFPGRPLALEGAYLRALEEVRLERFDDALATLDALLKTSSSPHKGEAGFLRAKLLHRKKDYAEAERALRSVLSASPSKDLERDASFLLAQSIFESGGREAEAAALFQSLLDDPVKDRFSPQQLAWLADFQYSRKAFAESESAARRLADTAPDNGWKQAAWTLAGRAAAGRGDEGAARTAYANAVAVPGDTRYSAEAHLRLGESSLKSGDFSAADVHFTKAAELASSPDMTSVRILAHAGLGRTKKASGDEEAAARYLLGICLLYRDETLLPPLLEETIAVLDEVGQTKEAALLRSDLLEQYPKSDAAKRVAGNGGAK